MNPDSVSMNFNNLQGEGIPENGVASYRGKITAIKGFERGKVLAQTEPTAWLKNMDDKAVEQFAQVKHELVTAWRAHRTATGDNYSTA
jgi:myo-inositol catabolism protein IolC